MKKIVIIGGGTMGLGIGQVFATKGIDTVIRSTSEQSAEKHRNSLIKSLDKRIAKGKLDEAGKEALLSKLTFTTDINAAADADLVVESAVEELSLKKELFAQLDAVCKPEAILATNTSSISITDIASATKRADKVIGNYFMGIPHGDDVMLNYQTTGFHETAALRELYGLTAIPPFQAWLEKMGFVENGRLTELAGDASVLLA